MSEVKHFDIARVRKDFPCLQQYVYGKPLIYFDSAATAQKPNVVVDEIAAYYKRYTGNVHRGAHYLSVEATTKYQEARAYVARFIGASAAHNIVFTRSATEAINLVASGLGKVYFKANDEIILTEMEHHSNIVPWLLLAKEKDLVIKVAPVLDDGSLDLSAWKALFSERTKLAAFSHISNALGTINPIAEMVKIAKSHNVVTVIDGAQGVHHQSIDVAHLDVDFYCFSGHKAYGPTGIGVLYGKEAWLDRLPPYQSGGDMIKTVSFDEVSFADVPQKFEAGTPNISGACGLKAALEYLDGLDLAAIHRYEKDLHDHAMMKLLELPNVKIIGTAKEKASLISFVVEGVHPHDISSIFDREGIAIRAGHLCAQPLLKRFSLPALSRASLAFYNTHDEIDYFINSFKRVFEVFRI